MHGDRPAGAEGFTSREDELPHAFGIYTANSGVVEVPRDGVLEFVQSGGRGWTWKWLAKQDVAIGIPKSWPVPQGAQCQFFAPANNAGTLYVFWWHAKSKTGKKRLAGAFGAYDGVQSVALVTPGGSPISPNQSVHDGLTTASAAGVQLPSSAVGTSIHVEANPNNTLDVVVADTQAKAALLEAAGGGTPLTGAGFLDLAGVQWVASSGGAQKAHSWRDT
jgi:hypothetical protein